jgi:hypothetical protein
MTSVGMIAATAANALLATVGVAADSARASSPPQFNPLREAYFGDLHLHTSYSFDAFVLFSTTIGPDEAYRFAKGDTVHFLGRPVRRREPLDFMAVTDHAENIGVARSLTNPTSPLSRSSEGRKLATELTRSTNDDGLPNLPKRVNVWSRWLGLQLGERNVLAEKIGGESKSAWEREIQAANRHYAPGIFTTFIAYEWTSESRGTTLHRNVIFKGDSAPYPFTSFDSRQPEDLWTWLETIRRQGHEALAIPHNPNESNGLMYSWVDSRGITIGRVYSERRAANEPLSEISQTKGTSETHPLLAPNDEFADFEIVERASGTGPYRPSGSYLRDALERGLVIHQRTGTNPYKYGFVGGSDLHTGLTVSAQADYSGFTHGPEARLAKHDALAVIHEGTSAGGLTGVWAESNTRESIYGALRRRETFATTGTRMKIRFFGGWNFREMLFKQHGWVQAAYSDGVPMGGDLRTKAEMSKAPSFVIWAAKDPNGANLDRAQVIKVWEENGMQREEVFDAILSRRQGADVKEMKAALPTNTMGASELRGVWVDPDFNKDRFAAYYLRVLEIPTPRWTTYVAIRHGLDLPRDVPPTVRLRGWSSPIWYVPENRVAPSLSSQSK